MAANCLALVFETLLLCLTLFWVLSTTNIASHLISLDLFWQLFGLFLLLKLIVEYSVYSVESALALRKQVIPRHAILLSKLKGASVMLITLVYIAYSEQFGSALFQAAAFCYPFTVAISAFVFKSLWRVPGMLPRHSAQKLTQYDPV